MRGTEYELWVPSSKIPMNHWKRLGILWIALNSSLIIADTGSLRHYSLSVEACVAVLKRNEIASSTPKENFQYAKISSENQSVAGENFFSGENIK